MSPEPVCTIRLAPQLPLWNRWRPAAAAAAPTNCCPMPPSPSRRRQPRTRHHRRKFSDGRPANGLASDVASPAMGCRGNHCAAVVTGLVSRVQRPFRAHPLGGNAPADDRWRPHCAVLIQRQFRAYCARVKCALFQKRPRCAVLIQRHFRAYCARVRCALVDALEQMQHDEAFTAALIGELQGRIAEEDNRYKQASAMLKQQRRCCGQRWSIPSAAATVASSLAQPAVCIAPLEPLMPAIAELSSAAFRVMLGTGRAQLDTMEEELSELQQQYAGVMEANCAKLMIQLAKHRKKAIRRPASCCAVSLQSIPEEGGGVEEDDGELRSPVPQRYYDVACGAWCAF